jgi:hypothetical protein
MKKALHSLLAVALMTSLAQPGNVLAQLQLPAVSSPAEARQDARKISVKFRERGYKITPVGNGDNFEGTNLIFEIELTKGMDCVIMVGIDDAMPNVDLYVKTETGNMIQQDTRTISRACVEFTADYNGVYTVIVKPSRSTVIGHFAVLAGFQPSGYN